tara:strand:- start:1052 stop:1372 length:321 start_codon:yes stop_codon:yes gene_type:complete
MIREPNLLFEISVDGVPVLSVTDRPSSSADHLAEVLSSSRQERPSICPELTPTSSITYRHRTLGEPIMEHGMVIGIEHKLGRWRDGLPSEEYLKTLSAKWLDTAKN